MMGSMHRWHVQLGGCDVVHELPRWQHQWRRGVNVPVPTGLCADGLGCVAYLHGLHCRHLLARRRSLHQYVG